MCSLSLYRFTLQPPPPHPPTHPPRPATPSFPLQPHGRFAELPPAQVWRNVGKLGSKEILHVLLRNHLRGACVQQFAQMSMLRDVQFACKSAAQQKAARSRTTTCVPDTFVQDQLADARKFRTRDGLITPYQAQQSKRWKAWTNEARHLVFAALKLSKPAEMSSSKRVGVSPR